MNYDGWQFRSNWSITYQGYNGKSFKSPKWDGKPIDHLVVMGEQGIGDEILYGSLIPELMIRVGPKALEFQCHPRLQRIFERSYGIKCTDRKFLSDVEGTSVALSDLMMWYRRDLAHFPKLPFLKPDLERVQYWRERLEKISSKKKIGIAWKSRHGRLCYDQIKQKLKEFTLINLQYGNDNEIRGVVGGDWTDPIHDIEDHINLIAALDRVVTVTQTIVHEAGAVGTPVDVIRPPLDSGETNSQLWYYPTGEHPVYQNVTTYDSLDDYSTRHIKRTG